VLTVAFDGMYEAALEMSGTPSPAIAEMLFIVVFIWW
jgi:hypothetical protein